MGRGAEVVAVTCLALVLLSAPSAAQGTESAVYATSATHAPISIDGDGDFNAANGVTVGTGTAADPYAIEGWDIGGALGDGIAIRNTAAHLIIRGVNIHSSGNHGIALYNAKNVRINNALVSDNQRGIYALYSQNLTIRRATVSNSVADWGIRISSSSGVVLASSRALNNSVGGIFIGYSSRTTIVGATIVGGVYGLDTYASYGISIAATTIRNATRIGLLLESSTGVEVHHSNFVDNAAQIQVDPASQVVLDHGYPDGGDYWSDYGGADVCRGVQQDICTGPDGIGDVPYVNGHAYDGYPLMRPYDDPPKASFTIAPGAANATTPFTVDARSSWDLEDFTSALQVRWDWEGDGVWDTPWSRGKVAQHQYDDPGNYTVALEVRDPGGATNVTQGSLTVLPLPLALSVIPSVHQGTAPFTITFSAYASGGKRPYAYSWDFGDGTTGKGPTATHAYSRQGTFKIRLLATDALGNQATAVAAAKVFGPVAVAVSADVNTGTVPLTLALRALPTGGQPPITYHWDFGDGSESTAETPYHTYRVPGNFTVTLRVQEGGGTNVTVRMYVTASPPRGQIFTAPPAAAPATMVILAAALVALLVLRRRRG